jgi:hypothetical protein
MADVMISQLTQGAPSGNALLPYSQGGNTLGTPVSAIFQNATANIGIGTTNPQRYLDIVGSGLQQVPLQVGYGTDSIGFGVLECPVIFGWNGTLGNAHKPLSIRCTAATQLYLNTDGKVGIGTNIPAARLEVVGDVKATNTPKAWVSFNGQGAVNQNQSIYSQYNISSVVKAADGRYTVNFNNALSDSNYCIIGNTGGTGGYGMALLGSQWADSEGGLQTTTSFRIGTYSPQRADWRNMSIVNVVIYGT